MERIKLASGILAAVLGLIVVAQNWKTVEVFILFGTIKMPNSLLLLLTFALGVVSGWMITWWRGRQK